MEISTFRFLWKEGIVKAAHNVLKEIKDTDKFSVTLDESDDMCNRVFEKYDEIRRTIREKYFNVGEQGTNLIDGHKICACIAGALLEVPLIKYKRTEQEIPNQIVFVNYAVAFVASIHILYLFLLSDYKAQKISVYYERLLTQRTFQFPDTNPGHDTYVIGRIKALAMNDIYGNDFDVLAYADMLYWIEKYNKYLIEKTTEAALM